MEETMDIGTTQKLASANSPIPKSELSIVEIPVPPLPPDGVPLAQTLPPDGVPLAQTLPPDGAPSAQTLQKQVKKGKQARSQPTDQQRGAAITGMFRERCRQLCLAFFRENAPIRSLGFTSSIGGEGKSFLSTVTAQILAEDSTSPVTLLECNWEHPRLHEYFGFAPTPGFAEWLREECSETAIRHTVGNNLTVIPAGDSKQAAVKLLQKVRQKGLLNTLACSNELLIVELPAITTTGYSSLAASLVESIIIVVRAGVTPEGLVAETCTQLKDLPVDGILLNQVKSRIPQWIRRII